MTVQTLCDDMPAISVVMPHYRQPEGLGRALAALAAQQGAPAFEVVVVDNASPEGPPAAICAPHAFVRLIEEPTPGPGPARSAGAGAARAPLIAFLDSDCVPDPDWIRAIAARFAAEPGADVIGGDVRILRVDPASPTALECYEAVFGYRQKLYVERDGYAATCNMAVRRTVFDQVGPFGGIDEAEDMNWGRRATAAGKRLVYAPEIRIATPARENFAELARKWDRQIGHDHALVKTGAQRVKWALKALAMPVSGLTGIRDVIASDRISGARERALACAALLRVRLWRARRMAQLTAGISAGGLARGWRD